MKKFYRLVAVNRYEDGFAVLLDGRPVKTSLGQTLRVPTESLAHAIMAEWVAQTDQIRPETMPLTQILVTCLDKVQDQRDSIHAEVMKYLDTDLICYRTSDPPVYAQQQSLHWDPIINWVNKNFGITLKTTTEISAIRQSEAAHQSIETYIQNLTDYNFTLLQIVTAETGSVLLAIALLESAITPEAAFIAAQAEELLKSEIHREDFYGKAPDIEKKQALLRITLESVARMKNYLAK